MACPLCKGQNTETGRAGIMVHDFSCPVCGGFRITSDALHSLQDEPRLAARLASLVYHHALAEEWPTIRSKEVELARTMSRPGVRKRAELFLAEVIRQADEAVSYTFQLADTHLRVASWSYDIPDVSALKDYLESLGALKTTGDGQRARLLANGHILYEEMSAQRANAVQAFVAMWFDASVTSAYTNGFALAIAAAGYESIRIDRIDYDGKIDDKIIAEIRRSGFVVADFTGHRGGVYYEAGFAHGLGKRVIFTCRKDQLEHLHFDVRQYNTIEWETPDQIVKPLQNRILALFGAGPLNPNAAPLV